MKTRDNKDLFSDIQIKKAAEWWAQYLPGRKNVSFDEINEHSKIEGRSKRILHAQHNMHIGTWAAITDEQYSNFIKILTNKIRAKLKLEKSYTGLQYLRIGHVSVYDPPKIVDEAMQEANIRASAFGLFPYKTEMHIYDNGQIQVGDEVISTDPAFKYFAPTQTDLFSRAPYVKIEGQKFKLVEVDLENVKESHLFHGEVRRNTKFNVDSVRIWGDDPKEVIKKVYTKLYVDDFNGSENDFLKMTNQQLVEILQNRKKFKAIFKSDWIFYHKSKERLLKDTSYGSVGAVSVEALTDDVYQYTTGPVRANIAPQDGTVGSYMLHPIKKGDFLIYREDKSTLDYMDKAPGFAAKLCDEKGNILSDKTYKVGDALPLKNVSLDFVKAAGEELAVAAISYEFKTASERITHVVPETERNLLQKASSFAGDMLIDDCATKMIKGDLSVPIGIIACSTTAISKAIILKDRNREDPKVLQLPNIEDGKAISKLAVQSGLTRMFKAQADKVGAAILQKTGVATISGVATTGVLSTMVPPIAAAVVATGVQQLRLPGVAQVPENEQTIGQQLGHMVACAGITASVAMLPVSVPVGVVGCFIGVIANSIFGKKREPVQPLSKNEDFTEVQSLKV